MAITDKTYQPVLTTTAIAKAEIAKFRFVGFDGGVAAAGAKALGISNIPAVAGDIFPVDVQGILLVEAGGAIEAGAALEGDAEGRAVAAGEEGVVNGYALDAADAAGEVIRVLV